MGFQQSEAAARFLDTNCRACSPFGGLGVGCVAACTPPADWASHILQQPDIIQIQIGLLCKTSGTGTPGMQPAERELCDHMQHTIALLNDKTDGFLDELLPNTYIDFAESHIGCIEGRTEMALREVQAALPSMLFAIGPLCSTETMTLSTSAFRAAHNFSSVLISSTSTAPSVSDENTYINVARPISSEVFVGRGSALLASRYNWKRVAIVSDDSDWAVEAAQAFIDEHAATGDGAGVINIGDAITTNIPAANDASINVEGILGRLESLDAKVVYLVVQPRIASQIFAAVYNTKRMYGRGFAWITAWTSEDMLRNPDGSISSAAVRGAEGVLGLIESNGAGTTLHESYKTTYQQVSSTGGCTAPRSPTLPRAAADQFCDLDWTSSTSDYGSPPGYSANSIDSIILAAHALNSNLRDATFRSDPAAVYAAIKTLATSPASVTGVSGVITLNPSADRLGNFDIQNFQISAARRRLAGKGLPWLGPRREAKQLEAAVRRELAVPLSSASATFQNVGSWRGDNSVPLAVDNVIFPGGVTTVPSDRGTSATAIVLGVTLPILFVIAVAAGLMYVQRLRNQKVVGLLKKELETFKDSIVGVRVVSEAFDPREDAGFTFGVESPRTKAGRAAPNWLPNSAIGLEQKAERLRVELSLSDATGLALAHHACQRVGIVPWAGAGADELITKAFTAIFGDEDGEDAPHFLGGAEEEVVEVPPPPQASIARARWWWGEDAGNVDKHSPEAVKQPGNWVSYNGSVCAELDRKYHEYVKGTGPAEAEVDLADRIGSTPDEQASHLPISPHSSPFHDLP